MCDTLLKALMEKDKLSTNRFVGYVSFPNTDIAIKFLSDFNNLIIEKMEEYSYEENVIQVKTLRQDLDKSVQLIHGLPKSAECTLALRKVQEGIMWLGMELKRLGETNPYPNSKDTTNTIIDKTADNLKF